MEKEKFKVGDTVVCSRFDGYPGFMNERISVLDKPLPVTWVKTTTRSMGPLYGVGGWVWPESALTLADASIGVGSYVRIRAEDLSRPSWKPINVYEVTEVSDCGGWLVIEHPEFDWEPRTINISDAVLHNEYTTPTETAVDHFTDDEYREFETGSRRDSDRGKPRVADLKAYTRLRFGFHMLIGSDRYGEGNFELGQPDDSTLKSIHRHLAQFELGDDSEDHLSAILFGIQMLMLNQHRTGVAINKYYEQHKLNEL